ncbi:MAG: IclR family transcriptional regulator, partial [Mycobacterium sp.]
RDSEAGGYAWGPAIAAMARRAGTTARLFRTRLVELADAIGMQVLLVQREGTALVVVDVVGDSLTGAPITPGFTVPLVAPFGREFVAWAGKSAQRSWIDGLDSPSSQFRTRMSKVLADVRGRGFAVERLSPEWLRVHTALQALSGDPDVDVVTTRLAATIADFTVVDFLDTELAGAGDHDIATVMVPVCDAEGLVSMAVNAIPFGPLSGPAIAHLGGQLRDAAHDIEELVASYGGA